MDCDDYDPSIIDDCDLDEFRRHEDCDDNDPLAGGNLNDCDGDGVSVDVDCNDRDASDNDGDCDGDGYASWEECDDPTQLQHKFLGLRP